MRGQVVFVAVALCLHGCAQAAVGYVHFHSNFLEVEERTKLVSAHLDRAGGISGTVVARARVATANTNATLGADFELLGSTVEWEDGDDTPKAVVLRILDDAIFERRKDISLEIYSVEPPEAKGSFRQEMIIVIAQDHDGGFLAFTPVKQIIPEEKHQEKNCLIHVHRVGGTSGRASVWLEDVPCTSGTAFEAIAKVDYELIGRDRNLPIVWEDGEAHSRCMLRSLSVPNASLPPGESGLLVLNDGAHEGREMICLRPQPGPLSAARANITELVVMMQDMGIHGGLHLTCYVGSDCTVHLRLKNSQLRANDTLYISETCASCSSIAGQSTATIVLPPNVFEGMPVHLGKQLETPTHRLVVYNLCLCRHAEAANDIPVVVGTISMHGPDGYNNVLCIKGQGVCDIPNLAGRWGLNRMPENNTGPREYLQILQDCGKPETTETVMQENGRAWIDPNGVFHFYNVTKMTKAAAGVYRLCWCRQTRLTPCVDKEDFIINGGMFVYGGPYVLPDMEVHIGHDFSVTGVFGVKLSERDVLQLQPACGLEHGGQATILRGLQSSDHVSYDFGRITEKRVMPGQYELCWCQPKEPLQQSTKEEKEACSRPIHFRAFLAKVTIKCSEGLASINSDGSCDYCKLAFQTPNTKGTRCIFSMRNSSLWSVYMFFAIISFALVIGQAQLVRWGKGRWSYRLLGRKIQIQEITQNGNAVFITTCRNHHLFALPSQSVPVFFLDTGHRDLDAVVGRPETERWWSVQVNGCNRFELRDSTGQLPTQRYESSRGSLVLSLPRTMLHTSCLYMPLVFAVVVCAFSAWFSTAFMLPMPRMITVVYWLPFCVVVAMALVFKDRRGHSSLLQSRLHWFDKNLSHSNPRPKPCPRGPGRAVSAFQLFTLHDHFRSFIQDRNLYYLDSNIIRPLCKRHRLSYAERAGPQEVQWFVSHYWGTAFQVFCESIRRHAVAESATSQQLGIDEEAAEPARRLRTFTEDKIVPEAWKNAAYWICAFSNNQYKIKEELGQGHKDSSFYLALHSGKCKGTCMILDELALPLTRSWCLFEILQTMRLEEKQFGFKGLLFCTETGVLNYGASTVELSMNIGNKLTTLSVENADATSDEDKRMINTLIMEEMGSFEAIDRALRKHIEAALRVCQLQVDSDFSKLFVSLGRASESIKGEIPISSI